MELVIALLLFAAIIVCWAFLPGTASSAAVHGETIAAENAAAARL